MDCPQPFVRAEAIENKLAQMLRDTMFSDQVFDNLDAAQDTPRQAEERLERSKTLFLAGVIDLAAFLQEKERYESTRKTLSDFKSITIMMLAADIRHQLDGWQALSNIKKKNSFDWFSKEPTCKATHLLVCNLQLCSRLC